MKKLLVLFFVAISLVGCSDNTDIESFKADSNRLYTQIFTDGEQSEKVKEMRQEYMDKYQSYNDEDLYNEVDNLYNSLGSEDSSKYLVSVMNLLNN